MDRTIAAIRAVGATSLIVALIAVVLPVLLSNVAARELVIIALGHGDPRAHSETADRLSKLAAHIRVPSAAAVTLRARVLLEQGDIESSVAYLKANATWPPISPGLSANLVRRLVQRQDWTDVQAITKSWKGCRDVLAGELTKWGGDLARAHDIESASRTYETAVASCPGGESGMRARIRYAELLVNAGHVDAALQVYRKAFESWPHSAPLAAELARVLLSVNRPDEAVIAADKALRADASYMGAYAVRSAARLALGDAPGSVADMTRVAESSALSPWNRWILAKALVAGGQATEARAELTALLASNPEWPGAAELLRTLDKGR